MRPAFTAAIFAINSVVSAVNALLALLSDDPATGSSLAFAWGSAFLGWMVAMMLFLAFKRATRNLGADE